LWRNEVIFREKDKQHYTDTAIVRIRL
jgi:hypothetical protein